MKKSDIETNPSLAIPAVPVICDRCRAEGLSGDPAFSAVSDILDFTPVPRRAQVNAWTPEHQRAFIAALAITGSARKAASAVGRHVFGADQLRKARGGRGFADAWDAALGIAREREMARVYDSLGTLHASDEAANARGESAGSGEAHSAGSGQDFGSGWTGGVVGGDWYGEDEAEAAEYRQGVENVREKLLHARRLYLLLICEDADKRAAWETLVGPTDWDRAGKVEPQDNEPRKIPNMRQPDMLLTAEAGFLPQLAGGGRDRMREFQEAVEEMRRNPDDEEDGPMMKRFLQD